MILLGAWTADSDADLEKSNHDKNDGHRQSPFDLVLNRAGAVSRSRENVHRPTIFPKKHHLKDELITVQYAKAGEVAALIRNDNHSLLSARGLLGIDPRTNSIWIRDHASRIRGIKHLISQVDRPIKQVQIDARIVNVTSEAMVDLGVRFGVSNPVTEQVNNPSNHVLGGAVSTLTSIADHLNMDFAVPGEQAASIGVALLKLAEGSLLDLELSALESENKVEVVSNPRLIATNQQPATIESGEEIPYQEAMTSGATAVSFKKAVLSLKVTPQITPDNHLLMALEINQDSPSGQMVNGAPAISTNAIKTNVLVRNGQTIVLGGIYKQDKNNTINRVPFLGGLPIIGGIFRNRHHKVKNEELLIFITPRIIASNGV